MAPREPRHPQLPARPLRLFPRPDVGLLRMNANAPPQTAPNTRTSFSEPPPPLRNDPEAVARAVASSSAGGWSAVVGGGSRTSVSYARATAETCIAVWSAIEPIGLVLRSIGIEMSVLPVSGARTPSWRYCS